MTESQVEPTEGSRRPRRWRYLIDIIALVVVTFLLDAVASAFIRAPTSLQRELFVFDAIGKMLLVGIAWGLIRLRSQLVRIRTKSEQPPMALSSSQRRALIKEIAVSLAAEVSTRKLLLRTFVFRFV